MFGKSSIFKILLYFTTTMITILSISFIVVSMEAILMYNPKPIEKLNKKTGIIQDYHFNLKNSRGYLYLKTFDNNLIKFTIRTDDKKIYEKAVQAIYDYITEHGQRTLGDFRDMTDSSRKSSMLILEYADSLEITKRVENYRVLGSYWQKQ